MTTRCNIVIEEMRAGRKRPRMVYLYRHHDGYPAMTGADVLEVARGIRGDAWERAEDVANGFLRRFDQHGAGAATPTYELTSGVHGDVDYVYRIRFADRTSRGGAGDLQVVRVEQHDAVTRRIEAALRNAPCWLSLAQLRDLVNEDRRDINRRINERNTLGGTQYELYSMVV
jgi:hypothetical protein